MGRPKLLLAWNGTSILGDLLQRWRALCPQQCALVLAPNDGAMVEELEALHADQIFRIVNPKPAEGMFSSIRAAASWSGWSPAISHWVVTLGDQPLVRMETLQQLLTEGEKRAEWICQPARNGRPRHPVLLPSAHFRDLAAAREENFKQFLAARDSSRHVFESGDAGLDVDLDFPADYDQARRQAGFEAKSCAEQTTT